MLHEAGVGLMLKAKPRTLNRNNLTEYSVLYQQSHGDVEWSFSAGSWRICPSVPLG